MFDGGITVDCIPAEQLVRPLVVVDIKEHVSENENYALSRQDLAAWEEKHGAIPRGAVVIANTGWASRWLSPDQYRNERDDGTMSFPGFSLEAVRWLVEERHIAGLGTDTLSIDLGAEPEYPVHRFCAPHGVYNLENVANLDAVPPSGATLVVAPLKLDGGSGSPVRLLALVHA